MSPEEAQVDCGGVSTVEEWLRLQSADPERASNLLLAATFRALSRGCGQSADHEDAVQETVLRAITDGAVALRRADPNTPLIAWLRACGRNVMREASRARSRFPLEASDEAHGIENACSNTRTPIDIVGEADKARHGVTAILQLARVLPKPYGHVLCWRLVHHLGTKEIRSALNAHRPTSSRPIRERQATKLITIAMLMYAQHQEGQDARDVHPQKYLVSKNRWIGAALPVISSQTIWRRG